MSYHRGAHDVRRLARKQRRHFSVPFTRYGNTRPCQPSAMAGDWGQGCVLQRHCLLREASQAVLEEGRRIEVSARAMGRYAAGMKAGIQRARAVNRIYRVVRNPISGLSQAVSEITRLRGQVDAAVDALTAGGLPALAMTLASGVALADGAGGAGLAALPGASGGAGTGAGTLGNGGGGGYISVYPASGGAAGTFGGRGRAGDSMQNRPTVPVRQHRTVQQVAFQSRLLAAAINQRHRRRRWWWRGNQRGLQWWDIWVCKRRRRWRGPVAERNGRHLLEQRGRLDCRRWRRGGYSVNNSTTSVIANGGAGGAGVAWTGSNQAFSNAGSIVGGSGGGGGLAENRSTPVVNASNNGGDAGAGVMVSGSSNAPGRI